MMKGDYNINRNLKVKKVNNGKRILLNLVKRNKLNKWKKNRKKQEKTSSNKWEIQKIQKI